MGRPVGYRMSEESRKKISNTQKRVWKERRTPRDLLVQGLLESISEQDADSARWILEEIFRERKLGRV